MGPPRLAKNTWRCPSFYLGPEAMHRASRGPLKGAVSAQKACQGSGTEARKLLEGTEENSILPDKGSSKQTNDFFKKETEKLLGARPVSNQ